MDAVLTHPASVYTDDEAVDCPECSAQLEVEAGEAYCAACDYTVDEDAVRDQLETQSEPPEWH